MLTEKFVSLIFAGLLILPGIATAGVDDARNGSMKKLKDVVEDTIDYAEDEKRSDAYKSSTEVAKAVSAVVTDLQGVVSSMKSAKLDALSSGTEDFLYETTSFRDKNIKLQDAMKDITKNYSSELSNFKSGYAKLEDEFDDLWEAFTKTGKSVNAQYQAIKKACERGCLD